ncbi:MAG: hypothetical protein AB9Q22_09645 [Candidatus Reddybacter sp.]
MPKALSFYKKNASSRNEAVVEVFGDWAEVDLNGDGFVDGWVFATYVQTVV